MKIVRTQQRQRRSLLALARERQSAMPLWKIVLIANGALVFLMLIWWLLQGMPTPVATLPVSILMAVAYCTPITVMAHLGSGMVNRFAAKMSRAARGALLILVWLTSGAIGSLITYGLLYFFTQGRIHINPSFITPMLIGNGVIAIVVGAFIFLFELMNARYRDRAERLGQQDLLTAELQAARNVQQSLFPPEDMVLAGFEICGGTEPAVEIGGDYYDYLSFADGTKGVLVADAAGKGVPAALVMAKFQGMAQALSMHATCPEDFFVSLNDTLRVRLDRKSFITVGMITIDLEDRCGFYRAGHNPLLLYRATSQDVELLRPNGIALGLTLDLGRRAAPELAMLEMRRGDVTLLYSDGLTEATDSTGDAFGEERLAEVLRRAALLDLNAPAIREAIMRALREFVGNAEPHDDVTLVVVKKTGTGAPPRGTPHSN